MVVICFENEFGDEIWSLLLENNRYGQIDIMNTNGNISIADVDYDCTFNTNDTRFRIQLDENDNSINLTNNDTKKEMMLDLIALKQFGTKEEMYWELLDANFDDDIIDDATEDFVRDVKEIADKYNINYIEDRNEFKDYDEQNDYVVLDRMGWHIAWRTEDYLKKQLGLR